RVAAAAAAAVALPLRESLPHVPRRRPVAVPRPARRDLPIGQRVARWVRALPDHRLLERLIGGRTWIVLIGGLLIGIVMLQVSMLRMNSGIGDAVQRSNLLEQQNAALRASNSALADSDRVLALGRAMGLVMPPQGSPRFVAAGSGDAAKAIAGIRVPAAGAAAVAAAAAGNVSTTAAATSTDTSGTATTGTGTTGTGTAGTAGAGTTGATGTGTAGATGTGTAGTTGTGTAGTGTTGATGTGTTGTGTTGIAGTGATDTTGTGAAAGNGG
ncbi:MAG: hypothetical protein JWQ48_2640, partial [Conexibacter sp.]|nr:hypothetical protein [Conexibacter sp.]